MIEPTTYSEWSDCVDAFEGGEHDEDIVLAMSRGTLNWNSGVATLFSERISDAFNARLKRCADRMERDFKTGGDETTVVRALLDTRRTLTLLHSVAIIPSFPETLQEHLAGEIRRYAERAQQSLEDSAKHDRSGRLASLMRNNSLLRYEPAAKPSAPEAPAPKASEAAAHPSDEPPALQSRLALPGKMPLVAAAAVVVVCVVAGGAWFAMRGKGGAPSQTVAIVTSAPATPAPVQAPPNPHATPEPTPTPAKVTTPVEQAPFADHAVKTAVVVPAPSPRPPVEPLHTASGRDGGQPREDSSKASALAAIIDEGEGCFNKKKFDCAISAAGSALRLDPGYARAVDLKRRAEAEQKRALDSISIN
ncbi:MAG: hypothetical protein AB7E32_10610 [Desulfovibrio sp.]